ncbi:rRNA methylase [Rubidibacter lacunae KORDI 51-2]|uniref:rRNA methylase n=1 Tax=Rubidibacter lacunae KORDI 51-2 TaxID=582515 RepID=U5DJ30_9CHRO|nr:RNA methyltransferase [Rubidibacter lacunae]ERN40942.1 rRNA methylase [Rubidibacter lacunae KORDI 51-2]
MLTSLQNPLVKQIRKLHRAKERRNLDLLLLEGTHLVATACELERSLVEVCATPEWQERYPHLWLRASARAQRAESVAPEVLVKLATTVNPDGVVATARRSQLHRVPSPAIDLGIAAERLQDPGNLGTTIRTAVAAEVGGLWLSADSVDPDSPKVLRASAGAWLTLPIAVAADVGAVVRAFQQQGGQAIATLPRAKRTYWDVDLRGPTLILLGNEGAGLSAELSELADVQACIPIAPGVESLNAATAAALLLFEVRRQRCSAKDRAASD